MDNNLLIGNGINIAFDHDNFSADAIKNRLIDVLEKTKVLYEALFNINDTENMLNNIRNLRSGMNIEQIADNLYCFILNYCQEKGCRVSINLTKRIIAAIKISALTAIFLKNDRPIFPNIPEEKKTLINGFDHVYSLNYYEFWKPNSKKCSYLHGSIPQQVMNDLLADGVASIFCDELRCNSSADRSCPEAMAYRSAIDDLSANFKIYPLNDLSILFSPSMKDKVDLIRNLPSNDNFPCWDNFPSSMPNPYNELENIDKLCVFGVSPYGDSRLIGALEKITDLKIFVHDKDSNKGETEINEWKQMFSREPTFRDSSEFWES